MTKGSKDPILHISATNMEDAKMENKIGKVYEGVLGLPSDKTYDPEETYYIQVYNGLVLTAKDWIDLFDTEEEFLNADYLVEVKLVNGKWVEV